MSSRRLPVDAEAVSPVMRYFAPRALEKVHANRVLLLAMGTRAVPRENGGARLGNFLVKGGRRSRSGCESTDHDCPSSTRAGHGADCVDLGTILSHIIIHAKENYPHVECHMRTRTRLAWSVFPKCTFFEVNASKIHYSCSSLGQFCLRV